MTFGLICLTLIKILLVLTYYVFIILKEIRLVNSISNLELVLLNYVFRYDSITSNCLISGDITITHKKDFSDFSSLTYER